MSLLDISDSLVRDLNQLRFAPPVKHVYNPLDYARELHHDYLRRFGPGEGRVLLLGMNPGPWGMAQTGVPFGEVGMVRDWMKLKGDVARPTREHPKRPVRGLNCSRSEVSGRRVWGWAASRFGTARRFFEHYFVINYCPLCFLEETGRNRTPDKLLSAEKEKLFDVCDRALLSCVKLLRPRLVVGVGRFAEVRARSALGETGLPIGAIMHPSPANPAANRNWEASVEKQLAAFGAPIRS